MIKKKYEKSKLILILFSFMVGVFFATSLFLFLSKGIIFSKKYLFVSFISFIITFFCNYFFFNNLLREKIKKVNKKTFSLLTLIAIVAGAIFFDFPKAFFLLPEASVEITNEQFYSNQNSDCQFYINGIFNGYEWISLEKLNSEESVINTYDTLLITQCDQTNIQWNEKIYKELTINFIKNPNSGVARIEIDDEVFIVDLFSPITQNYQAIFKKNFDFFNKIVVEYLPEFIILTSLSIVFSYINIILLPLYRFIKNQVEKNKNRSFNIFVGVLFTILMLLLFSQISSVYGTRYSFICLISILIITWFLKKNNVIRRQIAQIILILFSILILFPSNPIDNPLPSRDSGVFLYIGQQWLHDKIPYRDVWDHKPPMVFIINAIGLLIGNGTRWGVFFLEEISLIIATIIGFYVLRKIYGNFNAFCGSIIWLASLIPVLEGGNYVEEYVLPLQFLSLYFFLKYQRNNKIIYLLILGFISSVIFFFRQNLIGVSTAIVLTILIPFVLKKNLKKFLQSCFIFLLGFLTFSITVFIYFYIKNGYSDFINAVFTYNFAYSNANAINIFYSLKNGLELINLPGLTAILFFSLILLLLGKIKKKNSSFSEKNKYIYSSELLLLFLFPIEIIMTGISGRFYPHYFMAWLPLIALSSSYLFFRMQKKTLDALKKTIGEVGRYLLQITTILVILILSFSSLISLNKPLINNQVTSKLDLVRFIESNTNPEDYVLIWGAETAINFVSGRESPTKFVYQFPLHNKEFRTTQHIKEFINEIRGNPPIFIIDIDKDHPLNELNQDIYFREFLEYFKENYELVNDIDLYVWPIYKYKIQNK